MSPTFTIGKLSRMCDVPTSTLRYYERVGLLEPAGRTEGNYRVYDDVSLQRIRFIRTAQAAGFSLSDIATLVNAETGDDSPCGTVEHLIERRLDDVRARLDNLRIVQNRLEEFLKSCQVSTDKAHCGVLDSLTHEDSAD